MMHLRKSIDNKRVLPVGTLLVALLGAASAHGSGLEDGLVAHWALDEGDGILATDRVGGLEATLVGDAQFERGRLGGGLTVDGDGDYLSTPNAPAIDLSDVATISFWIASASAVSSFPPVVWKLDPGLSGLKIQKWADTTSLDLRIDTSSGASQSGGGVEVLPDVFDGEWHHVVWVLDRGLKRGYKDGVLVVDSQYLHGDGFANGSALALMGNSSGSSTIAGRMDDLRLYDRVLSNDEVAELYHRGQPDPAKCGEIELAHPMFSNPSIRPTFAPAPEDYVRDPIVTRDLDGDGNIVTRGVSQYVATAEYPEQPLLRCGFLDPTAPPFDADPSGRAASAAVNTQALNDALRVAREQMLAVYLPPGRYVVDGKIECAQSLTATVLGTDPLKRKEDRQGACVLIGSRRDTRRPEIVLAAGAAGYGDSTLVKPLVIFWARHQTDPFNQQPGINFNNMIAGVDFDLGGNAGAVGIDLDGAQGTGIEEVTIEATGAYAGLSVIPGAGGATHQLTVVGGQYGIDTAIPKANLQLEHFIDSVSQGGVPTVSGSTFRGQTVAAIRYRQLETLSLVGARIVVPAGVTGPAIVSGKRFESGGHTAGTMTLVDSSIEFEAPDPANTAIDVEFSAYLKDVFVRNATTALTSVDGDLLPGDGSDWLHIREYAASVKPFPHHETEVQYDEPSYLDGLRQTTDYSVLGSRAPAPADLQSRHQWQDDLPSWETFGVVNVKLPPYSAAGDGRTDDTAALQAALDDHPRGVIYLPKGYYKVTSTLELSPDTRLAGTARHLSHLLADNDPNGDFADSRYGTSEQPVVRSADNPEGTAQLAFLSLYSPHEVPGSYPLNWRTGGRSTLRAVSITSRSLTSDFSPANDSPPRVPHVLVSDSGGGRWYSYFRDFRYLENWPEMASFRMFKVDGTREPLAIYQANPEGQAAGGDAKMEIADAADVDIYGYKDENKQTALVVRDSERVHLYGYGGISWSDDGEALFEVERSDDFRLAGLFLRANPSNDGNPGTWSMVRETLPSGELFETTPLDLPTLYKRGGPIDVTPPVVGEKTSVPVATANPTPSYTFSSSEAGTITYGGSCSSSTLTARASDNQVTLDRLAPGLYEDCTVRVADRSLNDSAELAITPFAIVAPSATLTGDCPGAIALTIDGGAPNGTFALLGGTAVGDDLVPSGTCAGRITRLDGARVVAIGTLNEQGGAQLERSISTALCGNYLQVVDIVTCEMSPLVVLPETEKR